MNLSLKKAISTAVIALTAVSTAAAPVLAMHHVDAPIDSSWTRYEDASNTFGVAFPYSNITAQGTVQTPNGSTGPVNMKVTSAYSVDGLSFWVTSFNTANWAEARDLELNNGSFDVMEKTKNLVKAVFPNAQTNTIWIGKATMGISRGNQGEKLNDFWFNSGNGYVVGRLVKSHNKLFVLWHPYSYQFTAATNPSAPIYSQFANSFSAR